MESSTIFQDKKLEARYKLKLNSSFETKLQLYLFSKAISAKEIDPIDEAEFAKFIIKEDIVKQYTTEYWQLPLDEKYGKSTIKEIDLEIRRAKKDFESQINELKKEYENKFYEVYSKEDFSLCSL